MYSKSRREQYRKTRRDYLGIVILVIATILILSSLTLSLIIGVVLTVVISTAGLTLLLVAAYLDSNVRLRYQRTLPPIDQPRIVASDWESTREDIEPISTYKHLSVSYANFWTRIGHLAISFSKWLGLGIVLTFAFSAIQFLNPVNAINGIGYLLLAFLLIVPLFFLFIIWLLLNSYIFRENVRLFPEGHPYQDKVLWNVQPGTMVCHRGPARHHTIMDLEISHQVPRAWLGKRMGLILTYPLNFYGSDEFLNHFYIPAPSDLREGGLLRIYRLGLRFNSDFSDVYFRVHFISHFRYRVLMILWFGIGGLLVIWYLFYVFGPLLLVIAALFGI